MEGCARTVFKIDFKLGLGLMNGFYFAAWRYRCRSGCLDLHARLIIEQNQSTSWFDRHSLDCSAGDNFRQLLVSWHNPIGLFRLLGNICDQGLPTPT